MGSWYQISVIDKAEHLTATERRLPEYLVRNAGRMVSHRELLEATSLENIGTLRQLISRPRKKIEIDPALPGVIITRYGFGYSFAGKQETQER